MARLLPFRSDPEVSHEPRLVNLDDETADEVFAALSSDTARAILSRLYEEPTTASEVADAVDTSLQNARYHLDKLQAAGLVEAVDTWYSSRGTEMTVYAPTNEPLVVAAGREEHTGVLRDALVRLVGAVGALGAASVLIDRIARRFGGATAGTFQTRERGPDAAATAATTPPPEAGDAGATTAMEEAAIAEAPTSTPVETATETAAPAPTPTPTPAATPTPTPTPAATPTPAPAPTSTPMAEATPSPTPVATEVETIVTETAAATREVAATPQVKTVVAEWTVVRTVQMSREAGPVDALGGLPPGLLFFAGGLLVLLLVSGWWYWTRYRPLYGGS